MDNSRIILIHETQKIEFSRFITFHRAKMVKMLFKHIEQYTHVRTIVYILQLVRRKFINHNRIWLDVFHHIEAWNTDVACQDSIAA